MKLLIIVLAIVATGIGALHSWHSRGLYVQAALLSEAYNLTAPVKLRVSDHFVKNGVMPHDNANAQLPPPQSIFGTSVKRVAVNRGGVLIVDFEEKIGERAMMFTPSISPVSGLLDWRCSSDSIDPSILEKLKPACSYLPASNESKLMNAIANRDLPRVDSLLKDGAEVDAVVRGNTPLMLAARIGELEIVKRLLANGARVDNAAVNSESRTPLMVAITSNHSSVVALLLSHGASVVQKDYKGLTAMDHALATDRRLGGERYVLMVSARFNPQFAGRPKSPRVEPVDPEHKHQALQTLYSELAQAAKACHVKRLASLFQAENDLDAPELISGEPMEELIRPPECADALLQHLQSKRSYQAALQAHFAQQIQNCEIVPVENALRDNKGLSVVSVYNGQSHLNRAISAGCTAIVRLMVRQQDLADELAQDVLVRAIRQAPQTSLVQLVANLIAVGANVNAVSAEAQSPLEVAIAMEQPVAAKYLVDAGADLNAPTSAKSYPLIEATKKGYEHLVLQMVSMGADVNAHDSLGRTALIAAVGGDRKRLVDSLIHAGANTRIRDTNGIDAILLAESRNSRQIKQVLMASSE